METEKEPTEHNAFVEVSQEDLPSTAEASPQIHSCARLWDWNQKPPSEFSVHSDVEKKYELMELTELDESIIKKILNDVDNAFTYSQLRFAIIYNRLNRSLIRKLDSRVFR